MIIAIIAGGSGTRLWPLSQPDYPKHLLALTGKSTLIQNTYERARGLTDQIYVITEASHATEVGFQLPDLPESRLIIEPGRRGTASCITLALAVIGRDHPEETIVFLHADHHIKDVEQFNRTVAVAAEASEKHQAITLIGLKPTYPATGFGYIKSGREADDAGKVLHAKGFEEKPDYDTAKRYLEDGGYLWNLGLFAAPLPVFVRELELYAPELASAYSALSRSITRSLYLEMPSQPIDTALIEKVENLLVVPGEFDWADIGSFLDLHKILRGDDDNSVKGEVYQVDCTDSMIHGSTKPIIAVGLSGVIVVDTPDGLLVCSKEESQKVGDLAKQLQKKRLAS